MKPRVRAGKVAPMSIAAAEAADLQRTMQSNTIPDGSADMGKKCTTCGAMGATESGECLPCVSKRGADKASRPPVIVKGALKEKPAKKGQPAKDSPKQKRVGQSDLPGMPKPSGPGRIAREYLDVLEEIEKKTTEKGDLMQSLINSIKKAKRTSVQVDGYKFNLKHRGPEDKITVQKPK